MRTIFQLNIRIMNNDQCIYCFKRSIQKLWVNYTVHIMVLLQYLYNFINALYPFLWRGEGMAFFWKGGIAKRRGMKQTMIFMNEPTWDRNQFSITNFVDCILLYLSLTLPLLHVTFTYIYIFSGPILVDLCWVQLSHLI